MAIPYIRKGDKTDHGGEVLEGDELATFMGKPAACVGHKVSCPKCNGTFEIAEGAPDYSLHGKSVARDGDKTTCGAKLIASQTIWTWNGGGQAHANAVTHQAAAGTTDKPSSEHINPAPVKPHQYDEQICFTILTNKATSLPFAGAYYELTLIDGSIVSGTTDSEGRTARIVTSKPLDIIKAVLTPKVVYCCALHAANAAEQNADARLTMSIQGIRTHEDAPGTSCVEYKVRQDSRGLTVGEIDMAQKMFGNALDYAKIKIHYGGLLYVPNMSQNAMTPFGEIHFPIDKWLPDFAAGSDADKVWFMHEMTHVWQYQMGYSVALHGAMIGAKGGYSHGAPAYNYDPVADAHKKFQDFNMEQQGELVSHYFDAVFLDGHDKRFAVWHRQRFSNLTFYTRVLNDFLRNPNDASLVPNTTHIE